jgi:hypothetical protein
VLSERIVLSAIEIFRALVLFAPARTCTCDIFQYAEWAFILFCHQIQDALLALRQAPTTSPPADKHIPGIQRLHGSGATHPWASPKVSSPAHVLANGCKFQIQIANACKDMFCTLSGYGSAWYLLDLHSNIKQSPAKSLCLLLTCWQCC